MYAREEPCLPTRKQKTIRERLATNLWLPITVHTRISHRHAIKDSTTGMIRTPNLHQEAVGRTFASPKDYMLVELGLTWGLEGRE
jgi:hypothetical protein